MLCQSVYAQQPSKEDLSTQKEVWYDDKIGRANSGLINGCEYIIPLQGIRTHPFFGSREITYENLVIDGQQFGNVPIMYDIYSNQVVLRHRDKNGLFALIQFQSGLESFTLYGHTFKKMSANDTKDNGQSKQFYDVLMEGNKVSLIAKRKKEIYVQDSKPEYRQEDLFYISINDDRIPILRKKDLYSTFDIYESELRDFIKTNNLDVRLENDLILITQFCDSLYKGNNK